MDYVEFFARLFTLTFGVFAGLLLAFRLIWPKIEVLFLKMNNLSAHKQIVKEKQQLKFAAYERLILLVSRMEPTQVMMRHVADASSIAEFKSALIADVESEFQHNFTQQLYVSDASWSAVHDLKKNTVALFANVVGQMPKDASVQQFYNAVLRHVSELESSPYLDVQVLLKKQLSF